MAKLIKKKTRRKLDKEIKSSSPPIQFKKKFNGALDYYYIKIS